MRVGIITTFYNNYNYGGKLQAYALVRILQRLGHDALQIQYGQHKPPASFPGRMKLLMSKSDYRRTIPQKLLFQLLQSSTAQQKERKAAFQAFDNHIPHTEAVYDDLHLSELCSQFDVFICGSDQIWNPDLMKKGYLLDFVPADMYKFSYAASVAKHLSKTDRQILSQSLRSFNAISVREDDTAAALSSSLNRPVTVVADPVLLLDGSEWNKIASPEPRSEKYLFCYFLGYSGALRRTATVYAHKHGLRIITLPHMLNTQGRSYLCDLSFGDERLYNVSPAQFLALIRDAEYVMTDSFHATVLALKFQKQFSVYDRTGQKGMENRIAHLLKMYSLESRKCSVNEVAESEIHYDEIGDEADRLCKNSLNFIKEQLYLAELANENKSN